MQTELDKVKTFFNIVPVNDGFHYLCKDSNGNYFKQHKAEDEVEEHLVFSTKEAAQNYIDKYLDRSEFKPEIFGCHIDYVRAEILD